MSSFLCGEMRYDGKDAKFYYVKKGEFSDLLKDRRIEKGETVPWPDGTDQCILVVIGTEIWAYQFLSQSNGSITIGKYWPHPNRGVNSTELREALLYFTVSTFTGSHEVRNIETNKLEQFSKSVFIKTNDFGIAELALSMGGKPIYPKLLRHFNWPTRTRELNWSYSSIEEVTFSFHEDGAQSYFENNTEIYIPAPRMGWLWMKISSINVPERPGTLAVIGVSKRSVPRDNKNRRLGTLGKTPGKLGFTPLHPSGN